MSLNWTINPNEPVVNELPRVRVRKGQSFKTLPIIYWEMFLEKQLQVQTSTVGPYFHQCSPFDSLSTICHQTQFYTN